MPKVLVTIVGGELRVLRRRARSNHSEPSKEVATAGDMTHLELRLDPIDCVLCVRARTCVRVCVCACVSV
jgi:hypothetical protein